MNGGVVKTSSSNSLLISSGDVDIFASGDLDDYFTFSVTSNRPLFSATSTTGNPLCLGKDATNGHTLDADDVIFGEDVEVNGMTYLDGGVTIGTSGNVLDDIAFTIGTTLDGVLYLKTGANDADAEISGVIVGTSDISATAANSLFISNITTDGDILIACSDGGHSKQMIFMDGSTALVHLGSPGTPSADIAGFSGSVYMGNRLEVAAATYLNNELYLDLWARFRVDDKGCLFGAGSDVGLYYQTADANAKLLVGWVDESDDAGNNVPVFLWGEHTAVSSVDLGLLDEIVQATIVTMGNNGVIDSGNDATSDDAGATTEFLCTGVGTNAAVGDMLRVTGGTNATAGWYVVAVVDSANELTLNRNWCTNNVSGGTYVLFRKWAMLSPNAVYLPVYYGALAAGNLDIDCSGAIALDVSQANGRLYWWANGAAYYVDATGGLSLTKEERVINGHEFVVGDKVELLVDRINEDGSFHASPVYGG